MLYKEDWDDARERLTALWEGRCLDRPCISVMAPSGKGVAAPSLPADPMDRWLDPEWVIANLRATLANIYWGGESIPSYLMMAGWVVCYGATPLFSERTIWHEPITVDFAQPPAYRFDTSDPWFIRFETLYRAVLQEAGKDNFLVGGSGMLPGNDLLSNMLGPGEFLINLLDNPQWMRQAIIQIAESQEQGRVYFAEIAKETHNFWYGNAGWMPFWAPEPFQGTQSDVSCMLSPDMFDEFVVPELEIIANRAKNIWYHLDGHDAKQHLPRLCSLPYIRVIQYVPTPSEPRNGPEHLEMYRTIQEAGKIVHILVPAENVEPLVKALDPGLLCLQTSVDSIDEANALLEAAKRWMRVEAGEGRGGGHQGSSYSNCAAHQ